MYVFYVCIWVDDQWMTENIGVGFNVCMYVCMYLYIVYLYMYTIVCVST